MDDDDGSLKNNLVDLFLKVFLEIVKQNEYT